MLELILLDEVAEHNSLLQHMLEETLESLGEKAEYRMARTAEEAVDLAGKAKDRAVYFLDIELGADENGIDAAYRIHQADPDGCVVYVSAYQQYAMDCLHSHAFDFLAKPVNSRELAACMKAVLKELEKTPAPAQEKLLISCGGQDCHVPLRDIGVIRSRRNFCEMKANGQFYRWKEPLKSVAERLNGNFMPVSRNTLVSLDRIVAVDWPERTLTLDTGEKEAFSRSAGKALKDRWKEGET